MSATGILTGSTAGLNLIEGIFGYSAANAQADSLRSQLGLMRQESEADIQRYAESADTFKKKQAMAYMKSGVTLEGSPLAILDETMRVTSENISAMRAKTTADINTTKSQISAIRGSGRAALVGGFSRAASVYASQEKNLPSSTKIPKDIVAKSNGATGFKNGSNLDLNIDYGGNGFNSKRGW